MDNKQLKQRYNNIVARVKNNEAYKHTTIGDWVSFEPFKEWMEQNYVEGWEIDKDILSGNNKCYSSSTCLMVPREINALFRSSSSIHGYKGVYFDDRDNKFYGQMRIDGKTVQRGSSDTAAGAHQYYLELRRERLQVLLQRYSSIKNQYAYKRLVEALKPYL